MKLVNNSLKRIDAIQLLRGICAVFILLYHIRFVGFGCFGVDIFFIISGFIMMYSTENKKNGLIKGRLIRIIPLYYIYTIIMFAVIKIMPSLSLMSSARLDYLIKSMLFIPYESIGAGGESLISIVPILGIGWTLNLEVYFYLFFACANKLSHKNRGLITSLIIFGIFLLGIFFPSSNLVFKFLTSPVILEFVVGIIIYYIYKHLICNKKSSNSESLLCMFISIIYFLIMIFLNIKYDSQYRILTFGIPSFIIVFSFLVAYNNKEIPKNFLLLGKISYSFYFIEFLHLQLLILL